MQWKTELGISSETKGFIIMFTNLNERIPAWLSYVKNLSTDLCEMIEIFLSAHSKHPESEDSSLIRMVFLFLQLRCACVTWQETCVTSTVAVTLIVPALTMPHLSVILCQKRKLSLYIAFIKI